MRLHTSGKVSCPDFENVNWYPAIGISGLSSANYIEDETRLSIQTFSDSFDAAMSAIMTGEYVGLLPDYMAKEQAPHLGLYLLQGLI